MVVAVVSGVGVVSVVVVLVVVMVLSRFVFADTEGDTHSFAELFRRYSTVQ